MIGKVHAGAGLWLLFAMLLPPQAGAAELPAGTVLKAQNLASHLEDSFEGTSIAELLPERLRWQILEQGLTITLAHARPHPKDPLLEAATARNRGKLTLDPKTGRVPGWEAGVPFPDISLDDPQAALKVMWNLTYGQPHGDSQVFPRTAIAEIHAERGYEKAGRQKIVRVFLKGLLRREGRPVLGTGRLFDKSLVVVEGPRDAPGSGAVLIRYDTGEDEFLVTYAHEARKVVRWQGGYWMDQLGTTDFVGDDVLLFNADPTWYGSFRILEKKKILVVANTKHPFWHPEAGPLPEQFPGIDLANLPHWNPVDAWEPREVFVVEAIPPERHPYGRKVLYIDAENWLPYLGEFYSRSGRFWKASVLGYHVFPVEGDGEGAIIWPTWQVIADFRRHHGSIFITDDSAHFNLAIDPEALNLDSIKDRCANCLPVEEPPSP